MQHMQIKNKTTGTRNNQHQPVVAEKIQKG